MDPLSGKKQEINVSETTNTQTSVLRLVLNATVVALACALSTEVGFAIKFPPHYISPLWPTGAILFSVLVVAPIRHWWAYILAAYFTSILRDAWSGFDLTATLFIFAGLTEFLIAALCVRRFADGVQAIKSFRCLLIYFLTAVVFAPIVSASLAALAGPAGDYWFYWRLWFLAEALAYLTVAPAILSLIDATRRTPWNLSFGQVLEAGLVGCGLVAICVRVFIWPLAGEGSIPALVYLPLPLLIWAAVRFGSLGANTALLIVTGLSIWGAVKGYGPFVGSNPAENVLALQLFLATISVPLMLLAALVQEGHERASYLSESEARFRSLADTAPVLIWMSGPDKLCTFLNKGWLDFTGRSLSQEVGDGWAENVHPDDLAECLAIYTTAFNARRDFAMEYRLRRHDGQYRWVWDRGLPRVGSGGAFLGYVGCADDITERKLAEQAVRDSENELMSLTGKLITAQESERARLARELHDDLSQSLSLLSVQLDLLGQQSTLNKDQVFPQLRDMSKRVKELSSVVHGLSHQLHPAKLQQLGLPMAIQGLCREVSSGHKLPIEFSQANVPENISGEAALCLYRIAQESLQNIVKHSGARKAALWLTGSGGSVCLQVIDDGVGFDAHKSGVTEGIGLVSIRERLRLVGGELAVVTRPEGGAHIEVRVPIAASAGADLTRPVSVAEAASV